MDLFHSKHKLFDVVDANHNLLPVFNRFGIRPGFKDKTVEEICREKNIDEEFFLALINTYNNPEYFPESKLLGFSTRLIVDYLKKTHEHYKAYTFPKLDRLLNTLTDPASDSVAEMKMIRSFYQQYKNEFLAHIQDEEEHVFPFVEDFERNGTLMNRSTEASSREHTDVEIKLSDLKNLMLKYMEPKYDDNDFNEFLSTIIEFEKDIRDHARIEDHILFPRIMALQKSS